MRVEIRDSVIPGISVERRGQGRGKDGSRPDVRWEHRGSWKTARWGFRTLTSVLCIFESFHNKREKQKIRGLRRLSSAFWSTELHFSELVNSTGIEGEMKK